MPRAYPAEADCALLKLAKDHIADGRVCAIVLALGAGLGIDEMRELYWRDVQCKNNQAYLELQSDNAGATHNYSRPPASVCAGDFTGTV